MSSTTVNATSSRTKPRKEREWMPRFWNGMCFTGWIRLAVRNRFRLNWRCWYLIPFITFFSLFHSAYRIGQWMRFGWRVRRIPRENEPLFILGHWRSGTTLLHELLVLDSRHTYPNTYECFAPNHFIVTEWFAVKFLWFLLPSRRPMDNMPAGWERPQEDEFALCNLGVPSPYLTIAFPNHPPQDQEYLTLEGVPPQGLARWKRTFRRFLEEVNFYRPGRIIIKSPPHTCRIKTLLEIFPNARFIHIVRDPYVVFPSTMHLWKQLYRTTGMQVPTHEGLEEHVFDTFVRMYDKFERERDLIAPNRFCEVRYEDLVQDPIGIMKRIYDQLDLEKYDEVLPALCTYFAKASDYTTNRYQQPPELREKISRRWAKFIRQYGYGEEAAVPAGARANGG